jgi:hypothetical protein
MKNLQLPGIISVGYCQAKKLQPDILDIYDENALMKIYGTMINIPINGQGSIDIGSELVKGSTIYKMKATFSICGNDDDVKKMCSILKKNIHSFMYVTTEGEKILQGTHEKPYPTVTVKYVNDDSPTGRRGYFVEVNYQNTHSFISLE